MGAGSPLSHAHPEPCASLPLAICQQPDPCEVSGAHDLCLCISDPLQLLGLERSANLADNAQKRVSVNQGQEQRRGVIRNICGRSVATTPWLLEAHRVTKDTTSWVATQLALVDGLRRPFHGPMYLHCGHSSGVLSTSLGTAFRRPWKCVGGGRGHRRSWAVESRNLTLGTGSLEGP